ncbi:MAG: Mucin-5B [Icmadophila ericetorum]|nr:Mucin-5B [Icmadophila ericetorum]
MLSPLRVCLLTSLFLSSVSAAVIGQPATIAQDSEAQSDLEALQRLLQYVDPSALHAALHDYSQGKFKHGVFPEDRTAVEAVHRVNAPLATSIVALARRQDTNSSITVPVVTVTSVVTVTTTTSTATIVELSTSTDQTFPSTPSTTTPVSIAAPSTTLELPPASSTVVIAETNTVAVVASTTASVPLGPGPISTTKTLLTTTDAQGVTIISTVNGGVVTLSLPSQSAAPPAASTTAVLPNSITTVIYQTTTLPNGVQSTITAFTVIQASNTPIVTPSGTAGVGEGSGTSSATPGLQSGLAPQSRAWPWELVGALGGAIGVAMVL